LKASRGAWQWRYFPVSSRMESQGGWVFAQCTPKGRNPWLCAMSPEGGCRRLKKIRSILRGLHAVGMGSVAPVRVAPAHGGSPLICLPGWNGKLYWTSLNGDGEPEAVRSVRLGGPVIYDPVVRGCNVILFGHNFVTRARFSDSMSMPGLVEVRLPGVPDGRAAADDKGTVVALTRSESHAKRKIWASDFGGNTWESPWDRLSFVAAYASDIYLFYLDHCDRERHGGALSLFRKKIELRAGLANVELGEKHQCCLAGIDPGEYRCEIHEHFTLLDLGNRVLFIASHDFKDRTSHQLFTVPSNDKFSHASARVAKNNECYVVGTDGRRVAAYTFVRTGGIEDQAPVPGAVIEIGSEATVSPPAVLSEKDGTPYLGVTLGLDLVRKDLVADRHRSEPKSEGSGD